MRRVAVVGSPGAGKSTLAVALARRLGVEHLELDAVFHLPGWTPRDRESFRAIVADRIAADGWVVDGNYGSTVQDLVLAAADTVVWLDLPRGVVMRAVAGRTFLRVFRRQALWNGNRERFVSLFDPRPRENILLWTWTQFEAYRANYARAMAAAAADADGAGPAAWVRLASRSDVAAWLATVHIQRCPAASPLPLRGEAGGSTT